METSAKKLLIDVLVRHDAEALVDGNELCIFTISRDLLFVPEPSCYEVGILIGYLFSLSSGEVIQSRIVVIELCA